MTDFNIGLSNLVLIAGIKFLWWTWHDTDAPVKHRFLGVPIGSSVWVITFTASSVFLFYATTIRKLRSPRDLTAAAMAKGLFVNALFSTPLMMAQMAFLQLIAGDTQGIGVLRADRF